MELPRLLVGRRRALLGRLVLNGFGQAGAAIGTALLVRSAFDRLMVPGAAVSWTTIALFAAGLAAAALAIGLLKLVERVDAEKLGQRYVHDVRMTLFDRLATLAPRTLQGRSQGAVMLRFVGDLNALRQWVSLGLARLIVGVTLMAVTGVALCVISLPLGLVVTAVIAAGGAAACRLGAPMRETSREARRRRGRLAANLNERVAAMAVTQVFGQVEREGRRASRQSRRLRQAMVERAKISGRLRGLVEAVGGLAAGAALLVGAVEVSAGRASPGTVVAAMVIVGLLVAPLREMGRVQEYWHNSRVSIENIEHFLDMPTMIQEIEGAPDLVSGPGRVELEDVRLDGVLGGVSAVAEPGAVVAITGPNGAGKSTLLGVVARLIEVNGGAVRLDGQDLAAHTLQSVRGAIGVAGPDLPLLRGSVERNLRYRCPDADESELARVRDICELDDLLRELPEGAATRIVEGGRSLSAGQRQRLALARALVGRPRLLLLDEADANLDGRARAVLSRVIAEHRGDATILVISHREEIVADADAVWHVENGALHVRDPRLAVAERSPVTRPRFPDARSAVCRRSPGIRSRHQESGPLSGCVVNVERVPRALRP